MVRALLLAALLSQDGGTGPYALCPDAPLAERVDGGWLVSDARDRRISCQRATCEQALAVAQRPVVQPQPVDATALAVVVGLALVLFGGGYAVGRLTALKP